MAWNFNEHTPVYIQIAERLRNDIIKGYYLPDEQMPTVRSLAITAAVNPNTVQHAFSELESEGLIYTQGTNGRYVTNDNEILLSAKKSLTRSLINDLLIKAKELSIKKDELIKLIEEEYTL